MSFFQTKTINMTEGPIAPSVAKYSIPIICGGVLQVLFNSADLAIVGNFSQSKTAAGAAVGATGSFVALIVNLFMGLSVGVNVVLTRSLGSGDKEKSQRAVHTSVLAALIGGAAIMVIGILTSRFAMVTMKCPEESLEMAVQYLIIYFIGAPGMLLYNVAAAVLRSKGDTRHPMNFLILAGILNVILNIIFVKFFYLEAAGVSLATTLTQYLAAFLTLRCLINETDETRLEIKKIRLHKTELFEIVKYGMPSGLTSSIFCITNMQIQSAVNFYGIAAMNGNSAATNIESMLTTAFLAFGNAAVAFVGQNIGAGKRERVRNSIIACTLIGLGVALVIGWVGSFFGTPLISLFNSNPEVAEWGVIRFKIMMRCYTLMALYNILNSASQAFGYSLSVMFTTLASIIGTREIWMNIIYPNHMNFAMIFWCYPVSWIINNVASVIILLIAYNNYVKKGKVR